MIDHAENALRSWLDFLDEDSPDKGQGIVLLNRRLDALKKRIDGAIDAATADSREKHRQEGADSVMERMSCGHYYTCHNQRQDGTEYCEWCESLADKDRKIEELQEKHDRSLGLLNDASATRSQDLVKQAMHVVDNLCFYTQRTSKLETKIKSIVANAVAMVTEGTCDMHCEEVKQMSFADFQDRLKGEECTLCRIDENSKLRARVAELDQKISRICGETCPSDPPNSQSLVGE